MKAHHQALPPFDLGGVAGNGLVDRRLFFLTCGAAAGAVASDVAFPGPVLADALAIESWMKVPGFAFCRLRAAFTV
jgi:hypothetical protein